MWLIMWLDVFALFFDISRNMSLNTTTEYWLGVLPVKSGACFVNVVIQKPLNIRATFKWLMFVVSWEIAKQLTVEITEACYLCSTLLSFETLVMHVGIFIRSARLVLPNKRLTKNAVLLYIDCASLNLNRGFVGPAPGPVFRNLSINCYHRLARF